MSGERNSEVSSHFPYTTTFVAEYDPRVLCAVMYIYMCVVSIEKGLSLAEMEIKGFCMLLES